MKRSVALLFCILFTLPVFSQDMPKMGDIDTADLHLTDCDFDPGSGAYILLAYGETHFIRGNPTLLETQYRYRIKILKDKDVSRGNVIIPFISYGGRQAIDRIKGVTYNLDASGKVTQSKLEKKNIFTKDLDKRISQVTFTLPDVEKGSVIEYSFTMTSKAILDDLLPWNFQMDIPVRYSHYEVEMPEYIEYTYHIRKILPIDIKRKEGNGVTEFTMQNIPAVHDEPYMTATKDYQQHVEFQVSAMHFPGTADRTLNTTWDQLNQQLLNNPDFGQELDKKLTYTASIDSALHAATDSVAIMNAVFNGVRSSMDWDGRDARGSIQGVKEAWEKKKGNAGDINLILVDMLRESGIRAYPILVSTRRHGTVQTGYPLLNQFNLVLAYVELGTKQYVLNAADKYTPSSLIPHDVQYSYGYIVDPDNNRFVALHGDEQSFQTSVVLNGSINSQGRLKATADIYNYDYSKIPRIRLLENGLERFKTYYFSRVYPNLSVDSLSVQGQASDSVPLDEAVTFSLKLNKTGDYVLFSPNLFMGLETNPFTSDRRFSDIYFGYKQSYTITGSITLPKGYKVESLPKNMKMILPDTSIVMERIMQVDQGQLNYRMGLTIKSPFYPAEDYPAIKEFYKKLFAALNEELILEPESTDAP